MLRFNSKLVRLEDTTNRAAYYNTDTFQFQTGSIKSFINYWMAGEVRLFQFQTGSIKRKAFLVAELTIPSFQFQTGAIKRLLKTELRQQQRNCFNSKLVRLKV